MDEALGPLPLLGLGSISSCLCVSAREVPLPQPSFTFSKTLSVLPALEHSLGSPSADRDRRWAYTENSCLSVALFNEKGAFSTVKTEADSKGTRNTL